MYARKTDPISRIYDAPERASPSSLIRTLFLLLSSTLILWTVIIWMDATAPYSRNPVSFLLPHIRTFRHDYASYARLFGSLSGSVNLYFLAWERVNFINHGYFMRILCTMILRQRTKSRESSDKYKRLVLLSNDNKKRLVLNNNQIVVDYIWYMKKIQKQIRRIFFVFFWNIIWQKSYYYQIIL